jgi:hypothetical protein
MAARDIRAIYARVSAIDDRVAAMVTREEWKTGREEDLAETRRLFQIQHEDFSGQVKLIAEGHMPLADNRERLAEVIARLERLEHETTSITSRLITFERALERKQDKPRRRRAGR